MLIKSVLQSTLLSVALLCTAASYAVEDPSMQQIYDTAKAGKLDEAQSMMQKVLQDHPNSAKAHFVEAELLAKQGRFASAEAELANADRLQPGLPFAKPAAVENLRKLIAVSKQNPGLVKSVAVGNSAPASSGGTPWGLFFVLAALVGFIIMAVKFMGNRNQQPMYVQNGATGSYGSGMPMQPQPYPVGGVPGQMMGGTGGGMGSGLMGSLATGAALGAGMVAGEELMHHFTDGDRHNNVPPQTDRNDYVPPNDMGGNDFGVNDSSSWDSGSSGGDGGGGDW
jgi:hypothetical protein